MGRDAQAAARSLVGTNNARLALIVRHDPDMIRDVARAAIRPVWTPCTNDCARMDSEFGPCTCGAEKSAVDEARRAKGGDAS